MATASQLRHLHFDAAVLRRISDLLAKRAPRKLNGTPPRRAAVMMPLCNVDGHASCLFTKRSESVGTHKGQVSFPGGHLDNDETPIQAALREQVEELGDAMSGCEVLGQFDDALAGDWEDLSTLQLSPGEVDYAFTVPFSKLLDPECVSSQTLSGQFKNTTVPVFHAGPAQVWGLTAYLLGQITASVVVPALISAGQLPKASHQSIQQLLMPFQARPSLSLRDTPPKASS